MNRELFRQYFKEQETLQADKDPLFKKVKDKLKPIIDYSDKPSKLGYPDQPPPESVDGWHPEYGQKDAYYNKLDSQSANAMPATGNLRSIRRQRRQKKLKHLSRKNSFIANNILFGYNKYYYRKFVFISGTQKTIRHIQ